MFSLKKLYLCQNFRTAAKTLRTFAKKVTLAVKTALHVSGSFFWGVCVVWKKSFFTFELWVKSSRNFCSWYTSLLCCQNSSQRIQNYFFELFYGRISFSEIFSDFERNSFRPLRTLYSQNCSRILGKKSPDFSQKNLGRIANLHSTCPQVLLVDLFLEM